MNHLGLFEGIGGFSLAARWAGWQTLAWCEWDEFGQNFPSQPPICGGNDGIPRELDSITFSKWRNESIKAYGNAIVPQVAYEIFKSINTYEANQRLLK